MPQRQQYWQKRISNILNTNTSNLITHKNGYLKYTYDIFIMYTQRRTNIDENLIEFDKMTHKYKVQYRKEQHNSINFIDLNNKPSKTKLYFAI
jgi:hypothetical protein